MVCFVFSILLRVISVPSISEKRLINMLKTYLKGFPASVKCNSSNVTIVAVQFTKVHHRGSTTHQISPLEKYYFKHAMNNIHQNKSSQKLILQKLISVKLMSFKAWNYDTNRNNLVFICATKLAGGLLLKRLIYFEVMLNIF